MKHVKTWYKKLKKIIQKDSTKKLATCLIIFLFCLSVLSREKTNNNDDMLFVRTTQDTMTHNAAGNQRDYLFKNDTKTQQTYTGSTTGTNKNTTIPTETIYSGTLLPSVVPTIVSGQIPNGLTVTAQAKNCITPRKEEVKDKDFVLAYQQRIDVATICNVEKRICANGILGGTYTQKECDEKIKYNYHKAEVISYNQKILNEYIQPTTSPNAGASFTTNGKIDHQDTTQTSREETNTPKTTNQTGQEQNQVNKQNCSTPRGQSIRHGQFVKAYKSPRGFIDLSCKVELRPCIDGELKGSFQYAKCTFTNTTYDQYLQKQSPLEGTGFLFFQRIQSTLKRGK